MRLQRALVVVLLVLPGWAWAQTRADVPVRAMKVIVLSTMLVGGGGASGIGEWGFAAVL